MGLNPTTIHWMDVSNKEYYIEKAIRKTKWSTPNKYIYKQIHKKTMSMFAYKF
jgi:hypothetical protein